MIGIKRDGQEPQTFHVDWAALAAGRNPWKRVARVSVDPFLVARAVRAVMKRCPHQTATGRPLVWNEYSVFLDLSDWEQIKKLEATLSRDLGDVVEKEVSRLKAEMVGTLNVRLLRDEGGSVRAGTAVIKADFAEGDRIIPPDPGEMTVRVGKPAVHSLTDLTERVDEAATLSDGRERLRLTWPQGTVSIRAGSRIVLGRPHPSPAAGFVALQGATTKINKRQLWIEASPAGAVIGRFSRANPVEVKGRLVQAGGQIAVDALPADISLSSGEMKLTLERIVR